VLRWHLRSDDPSTDLIQPLLQTQAPLDFKFTRVEWLTQHVLFP
jgi:hypothetical protein